MRVRSQILHGVNQTGNQVGAGQAALGCSQQLLVKTFSRRKQQHGAGWIRAAGQTLGILLPGGGEGRGRAQPLRREGRAQRGRALGWFLMSLRTRKQKSKIDFALLGKSNKMVSGVKLTLQNTTQGGEHSPGARRKNHNDYKTAATTSVQPGRRPPPLPSTGAAAASTGLTRVGNNHGWDGSGAAGARCRGHSYLHMDTGPGPGPTQQPPGSARPSPAGAGLRRFALAIHLPLRLSCRPSARACAPAPADPWLGALAPKGLPAPPAVPRALCRAAAEPPLVPAGCSGRPGRAVRRGRRCRGAAAKSPAVAPRCQQSLHHPGVASAPRAAAPALLPRTSAP